MHFYNVSYSAHNVDYDVIVVADSALCARNYFMNTGAKWVDGLGGLSVRPAREDDFCAGADVYIAASNSRKIATAKNYVRYMTGGHYNLWAVGGYAGGY